LIIQCRVVVLNYSLSYNFSLISTFILLFTIRDDYLISNPRFKKIWELIKSWTRVGHNRVGKLDDQILCSIATRITLQFLGSPGADLMLVLTLAGPSLIYDKRTAAQLNLNNELQLKWGSLLGFCGKTE